MAAVQHIPVVKQDLRSVLQDPAASTVYVSWEAYVTCSEASTAVVARACEAFPHLQSLVQDRAKAVDATNRFDKPRMVLPAGMFEAGGRAVVYTPFWFECCLGQHIFAEKGRLNEDDILRWLTAVTSTICTVHGRYCTLAGAWQVVVTDDGAQLRAIKAAKAAMMGMTLSTVNAIALTPPTDHDAWIYLDWNMLENHPDGLSAAFCDSMDTADHLHSGDIRIPPLGKRRERLFAQWRTYQRGCYRDLERVVATLLALVRNRRVGETEVEWLMREDGVALKNGLKPLIAQFHTAIADAFFALADYMVEFMRWTRSTEKWNAERVTVDCWHVRNFPVLVEQLKYKLVCKKRSLHSAHQTDWRRGSLVGQSCCFAKAPREAWQRHTKLDVGSTNLVDQDATRR